MVGNTFSKLSNRRGSFEAKVYRVQTRLCGRHLSGTHRVGPFWKEDAAKTAHTLIVEKLCVDWMGQKTSPARCSDSWADRVVLH